jgi:hypothetical protein
VVWNFAARLLPPASLHASSLAPFGMPLRDCPNGDRHSIDDMGVQNQRREMTRLQLRCRRSLCTQTSTEQLVSIKCPRSRALKPSICCPVQPEANRKRRRKLKHESLGKPYSHSIQDNTSSASTFSRFVHLHYTRIGVREHWVRLPKQCSHPASSEYSPASHSIRRDLSFLSSRTLPAFAQMQTRTSLRRKKQPT